MSSSVHSSSTVRSPPAIRGADLRRDRRRARDRHARSQNAAGLVVSTTEPAGAGFHHRSRADTGRCITSDPMILGFDVGGTNARALLIEPETGTSSTATAVERRHRARPARNARPDDRPDDTNHDGELYGGLGVAGLAHHSGSSTTSTCRSRRGLLGTELAGRTGLYVTVMNDNRRHLGRGHLGAGRGSDDYMLITLGTGIGSGFVVGAG